jgi:putative membrane-bound dehydrogenase-like protein
MHKLLATGCFLALLLGLGACEPAEKTPRRINLLFLGHASELHLSVEYAPILSQAFFKRGVNLHYTEDPNDLNPEKLSQYDVLLLYAKHDSITRSQEKALLSFVSKGGGFMPIHCASDCFRNSEDFISLVGAQFASHDTATFTPEIVEAQHPITQDLMPYTTWDETYVHRQHNADRTVLMERVAGEQREPWTWVREYGRGRVFYTASGHDERTWSHAGFQEMLYRAIRWTAGERVDALLATLDTPALTYRPAATIPNYQGLDPVPQLQAPLSREDSEKLLQIPPGFALQCFAEEPDIINPIAFGWDHRGRLWVLETVDYPNEVRDGQPGDDRIKICEDTDGDGRADKFTVYAEGLNIPTGIVPYRDGVVVSMAPYFLHFRDTNGDDQADRVDTLLSGWSQGDTHAGPSNLKYGFDNQIWGCVGYAGFEGEIYGQPYRFGQGFYRFDPAAESFEFLTRTHNNTWGLAFSETFDVFGSNANNAQSWYLAVPDRFISHLAGIPNRGSKKISQYYAMHPVIPNIRQVDVFGGFTAAAGHNLYTGRSFPQEYWNRMALVCEPTGHLLAQGIIEPDGSGFKTYDGWNLLASADEWVSPVHAEVGPDGAVWIADWYNFIVQHNPTPRPERGGFQSENGEGNAHVNPLRDRSHGRIYRVVHMGREPSPDPQLERNDPVSLIGGLQSENMFWRLTAQRLLVERGATDVKDELLALVAEQATDAIGLNGPAIHALWTLHGLGLMADQEVIEATTAALSHPAAGVRKAAIQTLPREAWVLSLFQQAGVLQDEDLHTRLAAILALAEFSPHDPAGAEVYRSCQREENMADHWLGVALYAAAQRHRAGFLKAWQNDPDAPVKDLAFTQPDPNELLIGEDMGAWDAMQIPNYWEEEGLEDFDGIVWFFKVFSVPQQAPVELHLGRVDEIDSTYVNGTFVGGTQGSDAERVYHIPASAIQVGKNLIAMQVTDRSGDGGLVGDETQFFVQQGGYRQSIAGTWRYQIARQTSAVKEKPLFASSEKFLKTYLEHYGPQAVSPSQPESDLFDPKTLKLEIGTIRNEMKYDQILLEVPAGKSVELRFKNNDLMQHNWLLGTRGALETIGTAADAMAQAIDGQERQYIPAIPEVLYASSLVDPGAEVVIRFLAPAEPGDYPYVCTFPGHWKVMNGILRVK